MRNVRPSWVNLKVDGRKANIATGPRARSGEMSAMFYIREEGSSFLALSVDMIASADGKTTILRVTDGTGKTILERKVNQ